MQHMKIVLNKKPRDVYGGPYREKPDLVETPDGDTVPMYGVKMAVEIEAPCDINIPTVDFKVPEPEVFNRGVLEGLLLLAQNKKIYVGCMGGIGRTGLYVTALTMVSESQGGKQYPFQAMLVGDCIDTVRALFNPHAVETSGQVKFLQSFDSGHIAKIASRGVWYMKAHLWVSSIFDKLKLK